MKCYLWVTYCKTTLKCYWVSASNVAAWTLKYVIFNHSHGGIIGTALFVCAENTHTNTRDHEHDFFLINARVCQPDDAATATTKPPTEYIGKSNTTYPEALWTIMSKPRRFGYHLHFQLIGFHANTLCAWGPICRLAQYDTDYVAYKCKLKDIQFSYVHDTT